MTARDPYKAAPWTPADVLRVVGLLTVYSVLALLIGPEAQRSVEVLMRAKVVLAQHRGLPSGSQLDA